MNKAIATRRFAVLTVAMLFVCFGGAPRSASAQNAPPQANDDLYYGDTAHVLTVSAAEGVLANDSDPDGDPLTAILVTPPEYMMGTLTLNADGSFTYVPSPECCYGELFCYKASDGQSVSNETVVEIGLEPVTTVLNLNDSGLGSLRSAMLTAGTIYCAQIDFAVAGTINVATPLPPTGGACSIDGGTAVVLRGPGPESFPGLQIISGGGGYEFTVANLGFESFSVGIEIGGHPRVYTDLISVLGCSVGTDGYVARPNGTGIRIHHSGSYPLIENCIVSGNLGCGIEIFGAGATINGNMIGIGLLENSRVGNGGDGIFISGPSQIVEGCWGNFIAFNGGNGISLAGDAGCGNVFSGDTIYSNGGLGIDLGADGVTPNDPDDSDTGPNGLQNYPELLWAKTSGLGNVIEIAGKINSTPNTYFDIEFFCNYSPDPSGFGEGECSIGELLHLTTDERGSARFVYSGDWQFDRGPFITALASGPDGTSEFSNAIQLGTHCDPDGVSDAVEDAAPNGGDGNGDGVPDSQQANVASLPNAADARYVTLVSPGATTLADVRGITNPSPSNTPAGVNFPVGLFEFVLKGIEPGGESVVTILLPPGVTVGTYYKFGGTPDNPKSHWYEFLFDGTTGAEILSDRVILHFVDGQRGDDDLAANGEIVEPGGPALRNQPPTADAGPDTAIHWSQQVSTVISGQAFDPDPGSHLTYRWLNVTGGGSVVLRDWSPTGAAGEANLVLATVPAFPLGDSVLRLEVSDGLNTAGDVMVLTITNSAPAAQAGDNVMIASDAQNSTVLQGSVFDLDGDLLYYCWWDVTGGGSVLLLDWSPVGTAGEAILNLAQTPPFAVGQHTLRLEAADCFTFEVARDDMILTISNSPPHATIVGGGTYQLGSPILIGGAVSDFDGGTVAWQIVEGNVVRASGQTLTPAGGAPVSIPSVDLSAVLDVGTHQLVLRASDGVGSGASAPCAVTVVGDTVPPTLAPVPSLTQLWPPNHQLVPVTIAVNAHDNNNGVIRLAVSVTSDVPPGGTEPDWIIDRIENGPGGFVLLRLRSERPGKGDGRTYTITIVATDTFGNSSSAQVRIIAPHDKGKK